MSGRPEPLRARLGFSRTASIKSLDDRAVWTIIAVAGSRKVNERAPHGFEGMDLPTKLGSSSFGKRLYVRTRSLPVRPEAKQRANVVDRKSQIARVGNEPQPVNVRLVIISIPAIPPWRRGNEPDFLIMANHPLGDAAGLRGRADVHSLAALMRPRPRPPLPWRPIHSDSSAPGSCNVIVGAMQR